MGCCRLGEAKGEQTSNARVYAIDLSSCEITCHLAKQALQDSLAMRLPAEVSSEEACYGATDLCMEFWRGWVFMGTYKLPLAKIKEVLTGQVRI